MDNYKIFKAKIKALKALFIEELLNKEKRQPSWDTMYHKDFMNVPQYTIEELVEEGLVLDLGLEQNDDGKITRYNLQTATVSDKGKEFYRKYKEEQKATEQINV